MLLAASRAGALVNGNVRRRTRHVNIAFASRVPVDIVALMRFRHCYHSAMKTAIDACYVRNPRCPGKFPGLRCRKRIADSEGHGLVTVYAIEHPDGKWSLLLARCHAFGRAWSVESKWKTCDAPCLMLPCAPSTLC